MMRPIEVYPLHSTLFDDDKSRVEDLMNIITILYIIILNCLLNFAKKRKTESYKCFVSKRIDNTIKNTPNHLIKYTFKENQRRSIRLSNVIYLELLNHRIV